MLIARYSAMDSLGKLVTNLKFDLKINYLSAFRLKGVFGMALLHPRAALL